MKRNRASTALLAALLPVLSLAGCSGSGPTSPGSDLTNLTEPAALLAGQAAAISAMDAERYAALLEAPDDQGSGGFRYYPSAGAIPSVPWLAGDSWNYDEETTIMGHLLDTGYVSDPLGGSVKRMEFTLQVDQATSGTGGTTLVNAVLQARVTMTQGPAITLAQPVTMELARDADGYYRIRSVHELSSGGAAAAGVGSWTELMAAFRGGPSTPLEVVAAHAAALTQRNLSAYAELLHADFEYVPQSADLVDFPWITPDDRWDRTDELGMIANMFDPDFVSPYGAQSVDSIEFNLAVLNEVTYPDSVQVTCAADIQVLWSANSGAVSAVRLVFTITPDLRILRIVELPGHSRSVEENSWGAIKNLYRAAPGTRPASASPAGWRWSGERSDSESVSSWARVKASYR
jgi:hypothetical protein